MSIEETLLLLDELNDPKAKREIFLKCAKVGIFNPRTLNDFNEKVVELMNNGKPFEVCNYWNVERLNTDKGKLILKAMHATELMDVKGHKRKKGFYYKSFTQSIVSAPLALTPHAIQRFRERSCTNIDMEWIWSDVVMNEYIGKLSNVYDTPKIRKDIIMPFRGGAFLGAATAWQDGILDFQYKKGKTVIPSFTPTHGFNAYTYIAEDQLMPQQRAVYDEIIKGNYNNAIKLQGEIEPNHTFELYV